MTKKVWTLATRDWKKYFMLVKLIDRFTVQGIKIGYERLTKDGKCWWLAAVQVFKYSP